MNLLYFLIAWYITENDYIQLAFEKIVLATENKIVNFIIEHASCIKCLSFWITFFCTFDIYLSLLNSFIAYGFDIIRNRLVR